jgi:hypothetical protein
MGAPGGGSTARSCRTLRPGRADDSLVRRLIVVNRGESLRGQCGPDALPVVAVADEAAYKVRQLLQAGRLGDDLAEGNQSSSSISTVTEIQRNGSPVAYSVPKPQHALEEAALVLVVQGRTER